MIWLSRNVKITESFKQHRLNQLNYDLIYGKFTTFQKKKNEKKSLESQGFITDQQISRSEIHRRWQPIGVQNHIKNKCFYILFCINLFPFVNSYLFNCLQFVMWYLSYISHHVSNHKHLISNSFYHLKLTSVTPKGMLPT